MLTLWALAVSGLIFGPVSRFVSKFAVSHQEEFMKRITLALAVCTLVLAAKPALQAMSIEDGSAEQQLVPVDVPLDTQRFPWDKDHIGVSKLFPEFEKDLPADGTISALNLFRAVSGEYGQVVVDRYKEALAWNAFNRCRPSEEVPNVAPDDKGKRPTRFGECEILPEFRLTKEQHAVYTEAFNNLWMMYKQRLQTGTLEESELTVDGPNSVNLDLDGLLTYGVKQRNGDILVMPTTHAPALIGFNARIIKVNGIQLTWGPHKGWIFHHVIITAFGLPGAGYTKLGCGNGSAFFTKPQPRAAAVPTPAPAASVAPEPAAASTPVVATEPQPQSTVKKTVTLDFFKDFKKKNGELVPLPKNAEGAEFEAEVGEKEYKAQLVGPVFFNRVNEKTGENERFQRLHFQVKEVEVGDQQVIAAIKETKSPRGWKPKTEQISLVVPPDGDWLKLIPTNEAPTFTNVEHKCQFAKLPCWVWYTAVIGTAGYAVIKPWWPDHSTPTPTPTPDPKNPVIICNVAFTKCGGPGGSPATIGFTMGGTW